MNRRITIHKLSEQMGLTSRTLRHWEAEGLFQSERDPSSGWRVYDEEAIACISIIALLRALDIPIKEIHAVLAGKSLAHVRGAISRHIHELSLQQMESARTQQELERRLLYLMQHESSNLAELARILTTMEEFNVTNTVESSGVRIVTLPPMRVVFHIAVSLSPEDEAMAPVLEWIRESGLLGTARFFGGNVKPLPGRTGAAYGYGMCATIPENVEIPQHLQEMQLPGGLFAMLESSDDIPLSWKKLMKQLSADGKYKSDRSRLSLEEHLRNDKPEGCGNEYTLNLLEPVRRI